MNGKSSEASSSGKRNGLLPRVLSLRWVQEYEELREVRRRDLKDGVI